MFIAASIITVAGFSQTTKMFVESLAGSAGIASNNDQVVEHYNGPLKRTSIGYEIKNVRIGVSTALIEYGFSSSTYSVSSVGLISGYAVDFDYFGFCADAIVDYRLASLQRVGNQQISGNSLTPVDFILRPTFFLRPIKSNQSVELILGYELGVLDLDLTDSSLGISSKHRAFTMGVRALLSQPVKLRKADTTL